MSKNSYFVTKNIPTFEEIDSESHEVSLFGSYKEAYSFFKKECCLIEEVETDDVLKLFKTLESSNFHKDIKEVFHDQYKLSLSGRKGESIRFSALNVDLQSEFFEVVIYLDVVKVEKQ